MEMNMKKIIVLLLTVFLLSGCSVSSTSTVSTTVSNESGTTTTTTTTTEKIENGVYSSDTTTTTDEDPTGLRNKWQEIFTEGGEGVSEMGYNVYLAYDDPDDIRTAAIMVLNGDNSELLIYILGDVMEEKDHFKIVDVDEKEDGTVDNLPFEIGEVTAEGFTFKFKDGDSVFLNFVDQEKIIDDMISLWETHQEAFQSAQKGQ